jgi:hypothetical protein
MSNTLATARPGAAASPPEVTMTIAHGPTQCLRTRTQMQSIGGNRIGA